MKRVGDEAAQVLDAVAAGLPSDYGQDYKRAAALVRKHHRLHLDVGLLAWHLLDLAYTQDNLSVRLTYRAAMTATGIDHGQSLERAQDELGAVGLGRYLSPGERSRRGARYVLPEDPEASVRLALGLPAPVRAEKSAGSVPDTALDGARDSARDPARDSARDSARDGAGSFPYPLSKSKSSAAEDGSPDRLKLVDEGERHELPEYVRAWMRDNGSREGSATRPETSA